MTCSSWRETLRRLGVQGTSSGSIRVVRARAERLGLDYSHFRGGRRWTDSELTEAIREAQTWNSVATRLGLSGSSASTRVKAHAIRLGLDVSHLELAQSEEQRIDWEPSRQNIMRAGSMLAASWFALCGFDVSWPLEPCRYDLLAATPTEMRRVQVKTTTTRSHGSWKVFLSTTGHERKVYDPYEVDDFFIIDGELNFFLIPVADVGGLHAIHLNAYSAYQIPSYPE